MLYLLATENIKTTKKNARSLKLRGVASEHMFILLLHIALHSSLHLLAVYLRRKTYSVSFKLMAVEVAETCKIDL